MDTTENSAPLCRHHELKMLQSFIIEGSTVPSIFVNGHAATGKTLCLTHCLHTSKLPYVKVHCAEFYTPRLIYEHILTQLCPGDSIRCDDLNTFVRLLQKTLRKNYPDKTVYLVFEKAERLRDLPANILPAFLRLQELVRCQVCVVLESELIWQDFRLFSTGCYEPLCLTFPSYTKDDLVEILSSECPPSCDIDLYRNYCSLIVNVFVSTTRNLRELKFLTRSNLAKYLEPVENGTVAPTNHRALWKEIAPHLRQAMNSIYLHTAPNSRFDGSQASDHPMRQQTVELPYFSKYLLIASYLASYNPAKSDRKFFVKNAGKMKKTARMMKRSDRTSSQILGPKHFQLDRLMAIFYSIVEGKVLHTTHIYTQISNLVDLRLLSSVGGTSHFDTPKFKCLVDLELVRSVARTLQFDIHNYLYDFN